ncbi:unnamed protein product [marine sediment metagenome]|uniref:Uncharacterized protein n=1 Tax=marine sediment metagenome TaxID=412755 RepID=X1RB33_9ZZZZ
MKNDPEEKNNLFERNKPIVAELMRICEAWSKRNERLKSGG